MKPEKIVAFLAAMGTLKSSKTKRTGWVVSACPLGPWRHDNGKSAPEVFGVKIEAGDPHANCFACGWHGTLGDLIQHTNGLNKIDPRLEPSWAVAMALVAEAEDTAEYEWDTPGIEEQLAANRNPLHEFPEWWLGSFPKTKDAAPALAYLADRDVSPAMADLLDLRWGPSQRRICFPVRDFDGVLRGLHGRAIDAATEPRYRMFTQAKKNNPLVWLGEQWVDQSKPIVVVEGPFDLTSVKRVYSNVVSPLFANPSNDKIKRMSDALEWITFYDRGAGGDSGRERVTKALGKDHFVTHLHPPKGRKDPGEMSVAELLTLLSGNVTLTAF